MSHVERMRKLTPGMFYRAAQVGNLAIDAVLADIRDLVADYDRLSALIYHEEPAGDTQGALAVRPLKWEPSGRYPFVAMSDYYDIGHQSGDGRYWVHHRIFGDLREGDGTIEHHLTLDAAKAAAQEDHERKILWQIVGSSDPDVAPPNVEHLHPLADREKSAALVSPPDNGEAAKVREIEQNLKSRQRVAFRRALAELPEIAPPEVASLLSSVHMRDEFFAEGKRLQRLHGLEAVSPRVEQECGAGAWSLMRQGILAALQSHNEGSDGK